MQRSRSILAMALCGVAVAFHGAVALAAETHNPAETEAFQQVVRRGVEYLRSSQAEDGSFSNHHGPAVTALAATALLRHGISVGDPMVQQALQFVVGHVQPDGGIYQTGSRYRNYETSLSVMCLVEANRDGRYDKILQGADAFLKEIQWDGGEGHDESSESYGGSGYGSHSRPDLSNTSFLLEALVALGNDADELAIQRALIFVSRCQNLETQYNQTKYPPLNPDGGFYYTIAAGGSSQAGELPNGGLRSYGSMTYAGLKSMIYAGVDRDDPRVKAAVDWLGRHYSLEENPGMGSAGLYYYYQMFAKALEAFGQDEFLDDEGNRHDWRQELIDELAERQQPNGSWVNQNNRWLEDEPNLVTGYALLALAHCKEDQR